MNVKKLVSLSLVLFIFISLMTIMTPAVKVTAAGTVYYVSSSTGNDSNNGTSPSTPWKTLTKASSITLQPGDQLLLKCGDTWTGEGLYPKGESDSTNPIIISSYGTGNRPIITGNTNLQHNSENTYHIGAYCIKLINTGGYKITNLELANSYAGISFWANATYDHDYLWIEGCYIHDMTGPVCRQTTVDPADAEDLLTGVGIVIAGRDAVGGQTVLSNITIKDCQFDYTDYGISFAPHGTSTDYMHNQLGAGTTSDFCKNLYIGYCDFYRNYRSASCNVCGVSNGIVEYCVADQTGYEKGMWWGVAAFQITRSKNVTFRNIEGKNTLAPNDSPDGEGFDFESDIDNISVIDSSFHDNVGPAILFMGGNAAWPGTQTNLTVQGCTMSNNNSRFYNGYNEVFYANPNNAGIVKNCTINLLNDTQVYNDISPVVFDSSNKVYNTGGHLVFGSPTGESIWGDTTTDSYWGDNSAYEVGTIFRPSTAGTVTHIKVYSSVTESGNHTARIWRNSDNAVIGGPYTINYGGSAGWINYLLPTPVGLAADTDYTVVVSTGTDANRYMPFITNGTASAGNNGNYISYPAGAGVFTSTMGSRPTSTNNHNYLRDVVFESVDGPPPVYAPDVAYWKLDETSGAFASDATGNGHTGTLNGAASWTVSGEINGAVNLNSEDENTGYIIVPDSSGFDFGSSDFTISYWVYKRAPSSGWTNLWGVNKWNTGASPGTNEWTLSLTQTESGDIPSFSIESGTTTYTAMASSNIYNDNRWRHIVGVRDGSTLRIYVDGVQEGTANCGSVAVNNVGRMLYIGDSYLGSLRPNAIFDEVRIYSRALSAPEVESLYNFPY